MFQYMFISSLLKFNVWYGRFFLPLLWDLYLNNPLSLRKEI